MIDRALLAISLEDSFKLNSTQTVAEVYPTPANLINTLVPNAFVFAGVLLFFFIFGGGLKIVMNPDSSKSTEAGKQAIGYAIGGFLLIFAAYWIVQIIEAVLGVTILG